MNEMIARDNRMHFETHDMCCPVGTNCCMQSNESHAVPSQVQSWRILVDLGEAAE